MATLAVGDIHGNRAALDDLLGRLRNGLSDHDTVVFLGDYIDRGPDSKGCIDSLLRFRADSPARVVTLIGNHEDWLLRTIADPHRHSWLIGMEAFATIASYSERAADVLRLAAEAAGPRLIGQEITLPYDEFLQAVPADHLAFFHDLRLFHRAEGACFVHGGLDPGVSSLEEQKPQALIWGGPGFPTEYRGADTVVYGHWNNGRLDDAGWPSPAFEGATVGIDTIAHGVLTAFRLPDRQVFQSARFP